MAMHSQDTIVGVFQDRERARQAIRELKTAGFREDEIGVASTGDEGFSTADENEESLAGTGAVTGAAAGAGIGALWGLGVLAGALPAIGPAIAGGTLAALLSSAAAGATAAGLAGALIGMGMSPEEAEYYESELKAGRTIVSVKAGRRRADALAILKRFGAYDMSTRGTTETAAQSTSAAAACATGSNPKPATSRQTGQATGKVQAMEEKLNVSKTPVQTGNVTVRKEVHTEHKTIDVPVTREEIVVERNAGHGQPASSASLQPGQELHVPITEEQVHVDKQPVVAEEVSIGKRQVKDTQRVDETLRKEEVKVETKGNVNVREGRKR